MSRIYSKPPIIEAICDFHFDPGQLWDLTVPGLVYERIKDDFPGKQQQGEPASDPGHFQMQFVSSDKAGIVRIGADTLAINHLRPYPGWPRFKEVISHVLSVYRDVASPKAIRRISLRYINRIEVASKEVVLNRYTAAVPGIPEGIPTVVQNWVQRVEVPYEEFGALLGLQSGSVAEPNKDYSIFLLDLDFYTALPGAIPLESALEWVEQAHQQVETVFEACITDEARQLFVESGEL